MSAVRELDLAQVNARWGRDASALVEWAVGLGQPTIVTTNFRPFEAVILHLVTRANPQNATELAAIDKAYANFKRIQRAAAGVGTEDGVFTPAQLLSAAKAMDRTKDKRAFSEGTALLQDLAAAGKEVMPSKVPDSGTAGRLLSNITTPNGLLSTLLGAGAALPLSAVYSKTGSKVINSAVNKGAIPARNALQRLLADNPNISRNVGSSTLAELVRN